MPPACPETWLSDCAASGLDLVLTVVACSGSPEERCRWPFIFKWSSAAGTRSVKVMATALSGFRIESESGAPSI